jgi:hypothetical protein
MVDREIHTKGEERMEISANIYSIYERGRSIMVAPSIGIIAMKIDLINGSVSEPYLIYEPDICGHTWREYWGSEIRIDLGRCVCGAEIEELIGKIMPKIGLAKAAHLCGGGDEQAVFSFEGNNAIQTIHQIVETSKVGLKETYPPCEFLSSFELSELGISSNSSNGELTELADQLAGFAPEYMHPWDLYHELINCRSAMIREVV